MNYKEFMILRESKNIEDAKIKLKKANEALQKDHDIDKFAKAFDEIKNDLPEDDENIKQIQKIISDNTTVKEDIVDDTTADEIDKLIKKFLAVEPVDDSDPFKNEQKLINLLGVLKDTKITETDIIDLSRINDAYLPYIIDTKNLAYMLTHDFKEPLKRKQLALLLLLNKYKNNDLYTTTGVTKVKGKTLKGDATEDQLPYKVKEIFQIVTDSNNPTKKQLEFKGNEVQNKFIMLAGKLHLNDWARNINIDKNTKPEDIQNKFEEIANGGTSKPEIPKEDNEPKVDFEKDETHRDEILAQLQKDVKNVSYGYKTPIVRSFPRYNIDKIEKDIDNYFGELETKDDQDDLMFLKGTGLKGEMVSHLKYVVNIATKDISERSKKLNPDDYWNASIKTASFYNKTIDEGILDRLHQIRLINKENARNDKNFRKNSAKEDREYNIGNVKRWLNDKKAQRNGKKESSKDYEYNDNGTSKGESRIKDFFKKYLSVCEDLINARQNRCKQLLTRATGNVSVSEYKRLCNSIMQIMQDTKRELKEKEDSFEKVVLKGNVKKRIQDFVIDKTDIKDPNKNAYAEDQKKYKIDDAAENLFNKNNSKKTQQIAKWVLAKLILQFDNYTPRQMLREFNKAFSALNKELGGTFHEHSIYNIDNIKNFTTKHEKYTVINFANIKPNASYNTPMELFRATLDGFKNVGLGNLELLKNVKSALKNDGFKSKVEEFSKEMDLYFKARTKMQDIMKHLQQPANTTSINTEKYVKNLAESIFGNNGCINMIWEEGEQEPVQTNNFDKSAIFAKFGALTSNKLSKLLGVGAGKINFDETGPEDLAAIQQFIHSELAIIQDGTENYVCLANKVDGLLKALSEQPTEADNVITTQNDDTTRNKYNKTTGQGLLKRAPQVLAAHNYGQSAEDGTRGASDPNQDESGFSVATEPKATVTTGAVGDVTIPQRLPTSQDVIKRKLNYTTYTYKNGPITVQKRKYDD